jgi:mRNA interferase MazF
MNTRHVTGQVNAIQLRSLDFISERRAIKKVDELDPETFGKVAQFIRFIFDFDQVIDFGE